MVAYVRSLIEIASHPNDHDLADFVHVVVVSIVNFLCATIPRILSYMFINICTFVVFNNGSIKTESYQVIVDLSPSHF